MFFSYDRIPVISLSFLCLSMAILNRSCLLGMLSLGSQKFRKKRPSVWMVGYNFILFSSFPGSSSPLCLGASASSFFCHLFASAVSAFLSCRFFVSSASASPFSAASVFTLCSFLQFGSLSSAAALASALLGSVLSACAWPLHGFLLFFCVYL